MKDNYNYKGWLTSQSFWKRAFAVYGYYAVASFALGVGVLFLLFVFTLIFS